MIPDELLITRPSSGKVWRIIEHQEQAATRRITRSAPAQSRLEELLDQNKPVYLPGSEQLHWLLKTPFRYPPLAHGSRFGSPFEPGILYAARELHTAMTESAVYLWLFRAALYDPGPLERISDGRTAIHFPVSHDRFSDLSANEEYRQQISDPANYQFSQALGTRLREADAAAIWFHSARTEQGVNCAILNPGAIPTGTVPEESHWQLQLDETYCWWGQVGGESFEVHYQEVANSSGTIPHPAL